MPFKHLFVSLFLAVLVVPDALAHFAADGDEKKKPVDYVDPLVGTSHSRWMLFPGASMPFGMVKLSPDNEEEAWKAGYEYYLENLAGFSHLHSWTMGGLLVMPTTGPLQIDPGPADHPDAGYRSRFSHERETAEAGYYAVTLDDYDIRAELTATTRSGFQRYTFPASDQAHVLFDLDFPTEYGFDVRDAVITKVSDSEIEGYSDQQSGPRARFNEYILHFVIRFSKPFDAMGAWHGDEVLQDVAGFSGSGDVGFFVRYSDLADGEAVLVKSGISLVSIDQARLNLVAESGPFGWDFDAARAHARTTWNDLLQTVEVEGGTENDLTKFYTNLYRSYVGRTIWSDVDGKYVDMCEEAVQLEDPSSPIYGGDAFWNTFWNLNQLWTLVTPDVASSWVRSLVEIYERGGWLPKGPTGIEYSSIMVASHAIPLIVSAYQKGIRDFDVETAYEAVKHNQTVPGREHDCGGHVGNRQLTSYMEHGYVPNEAGPTSNTLEYAYDDWSVSQFAKALGRNKDYGHFATRAQNYRNIFDPSVGYMRQRHADGTWVEPFDPICCSTFHGQGWVEGNAWQYTWFVPHDLAGLIDLLGGTEVFNARLDEGFEKSKPYDFNAEYQHENNLIAMGLLPINHGNQPNMQAAYLFNYSGAPWLAQKWAREIMERFYGLGPETGWPGDEDQGQMGAWYVMSAMGLFEMDGGASVDPIYEIGSPLFERITIHLDEDYYPGGTFVIEARNASDENKYVQSAWLDGEPLHRPWFYHRDLVDGGTLVLEMGPEPNKAWGSSPEDAPPSSL